MGRIDYRGGQAPLRTATELSTVLPIPILMVGEGHAMPSFPKTDRSNPSPVVTVVPSIPDPRFSSLGFPLGVHWTQWNSVAVPVIERLQTYQWRGTIGSLGQTLLVLQDVVGPAGVVAFAEGFTAGSSVVSEESVGRLYACDPPQVRGKPQSKTYAYLANIALIIYQTAVDAGY